MLLTPVFISISIFRPVVFSQLQLDYRAPALRAGLKNTAYGTSKWRTEYHQKLSRNTVNFKIERQMF